jgi:hypothetical protein
VREFAVGEFWPAKNRLRVKGWLQSPHHRILRIQFVASAIKSRNRRLPCALTYVQGASAQHEIEGVDRLRLIKDRQPSTTAMRRPECPQSGARWRLKPKILALAIDRSLR